MQFERTRADFSVFLKIRRILHTFFSAFHSHFLKSFFFILLNKGVLFLVLKGGENVGEKINVSFNNFNKMHDLKYVHHASYVTVSKYPTLRHYDTHGRF